MSIINDWIIAIVLLFQSCLLAWIAYDTNKRTEIKKFAAAQATRIKRIIIAAAPFVSLSCFIVGFASIPWPPTKATFLLCVLSISLFLSSLVLWILNKMFSMTLQDFRHARRLHKIQMSVYDTLAARGVLSQDESQVIHEKVIESHDILLNSIEK